MQLNAERTNPQFECPRTVSHAFVASNYRVSGDLRKPVAFRRRLGSVTLTLNIRRSSAAANSCSRDLRGKRMVLGWTGCSPVTHRTAFRKLDTHARYAPAVAGSYVPLKRWRGPEGNRTD